MKRSNKGSDMVQARVSFRAGPGPIINFGQKFAADDPAVMAFPTMFERVPDRIDIKTTATVAGEVAAPPSFMDDSPDPVSARPNANANKGAWLKYLLTLTPKESVEGLAEMTKAELIAACDALET